MMTMPMNMNEVKDNINQVGRTSFLVGMGLIATAEETVSGFMNSLVEKGEGYQSKEGSVKKTASESKDKIKAFTSKIEERIQGTIETGLGRLGIPSKAEIATLIDKVNTLNKKVESLK